MINEQELGEKQANLEKNKDTYQQQMDELNVILDERQSELSSLDESMRLLILIFQISSHRLMLRITKCLLF